MTDNNRVSSIDIMRVLMLFLMILVNDMYMSGIPSWLGHCTDNSQSMGVSGWVFPGFLFIVGMVIPFSIDKRIAEGQKNIAIAKHIAVRTISLLIIGILMINADRVNPEFTGFGKNLWALLMYTGVFLIWNNYQENKMDFFTISGLKLAGTALLVFLVFKFRSGEFVNNGSLITGSWGITGIIGWGYLVAAFIYLAVRDNILCTVLAFIFFLALNFFSKLELLAFLDTANPIFGVIIEGNVPMIVIAGTLTALILKKYSEKDIRKLIVTIVTIGSVSVIAGLVLRNWFIISKEHSSPGWGLLCIGISMILFAIFHWIIDIKKFTNWTSFIKPAGENSLTASLVLIILYQLIQSTGVPILIFKQTEVPLIIISGSLLWALLMIWITATMVKYNIRLKL